MLDWNPELYRRFEDERTRPARELLARVPLARAARVSTSAAAPATRPSCSSGACPARGVGIDNSEAMLASARQRLPGPRFELGDIAQWQPDAPPDLIYANAALQWVPDHETLFPRLFAVLAPGRRARGADARQPRRAHATR